MTAFLGPHNASGAAVLLLLLTPLWLLTACGELDEEETRQVNEALSDSLLSTTETRNLDLTLIEQGRKMIRLQGRYAATYNNREIDETRISGPVTIHVFDSTAAIKTWVWSDSAIYQAEDSQFEFYGDVRVKTRDERNLESEYLRWDQANNQISTPRFVIITTPTDSIAGTGFSGTSDLSSYTIREPTGRYMIE